MNSDSEHANEPAYVVPDFAADAVVRERYNGVAKALIATAVNEAAAGIKHEYEVTYGQKLRAAEAADAAAAIADHQAHVTRAKYAALVPKQRTASGIVKPPKFFFDIIVTMGASNKFYNDALEAHERKREAAAAARAARTELERVRGRQEAAIVKSELEVRRYFKTDRGRSDLDGDPRLHELAVTCAAIEAERADFARRLARGDVDDPELRDRAMAEHGHRYLDGDLRGLHCLRERDARFGRLRYYTFRDRDGRIWLLDFHEDLWPLTRIDFDTIYANERYLIARSAAADTRVTAGKTRGLHDGPDPRLGRGVDPALLAALREFVARETAGLRR